VERGTNLNLEKIGQVTDNSRVISA